jgi:single-strand DNA-binding protein
MNIVTLVGRVGKDPELKQFGDNQIAKFSLATRRLSKDAPTDWHNIDAWNKTAEIVGKYVKKGDMLAVTGRIEYSAVDKDGKKTTYTNIIADRVELMPSGKKEEITEQPPVLHGSIPDLDEIPF